MPDDETDLSSCPYYNGTGICSFSCWGWGEPRCRTEEPLNGWPSQRTAVARTLDVAEETADKARAVGLARSTDA